MSGWNKPDSGVVSVETSRLRSGPEHPGEIHLSREVVNCHAVSKLIGAQEASVPVDVREVMIMRELAEKFSTQWIEAWNSHDLDRILLHYSDDFEMSSPNIAQIAGEPSERSRGRLPAANGPRRSSERRRCGSSRFRR